MYLICICKFILFKLKIFQKNVFAISFFLNRNKICYIRYL